ncbi:MAG: type II CAAX prenyl endopeptidase Rce1 family protein [Candidatus Thorarchaeota archaeon]
MTDEKSPNSEEKYIEKDTNTNLETIICPKCNTENSKSNLFCRKCGSPFVDKVNCRRCYSLNPVYNSYCSNCGAILRQTLSQQPTQPEPYSPQTHASPQYSPYQQGYTPYMTGQPVVYRDPNDPFFREQYKRAKQETANTAGLIIGIILVSLGILSIIGSILIIAYTPMVIEDILIGTGLTEGYFYGALISMLIVPSIVVTTTGFALIRYKPENNAWKGAYYILRYIFLIISSLSVILAVIIIFSWIFYNPTNQVTGALPFWLFYMFTIPINSISLMFLVSLEILVFLLCIISLSFPLVRNLIKYFKQKSEAKINNDKELKQFPVDENIEDYKLISSEKEYIALEYSDMKLSKVELKKGRLPTLFYKIKNTPIIGSMELFAGSYFVSYVFIFLFSPLIPTEDGGEAVDPFIFVLQLAWAGIFEELSFRLILIGIPLIFVVLVRFLRQSEKLAITNVPRNERTDLNRIDILEEKQTKEQIRPYEIPLALRGKTRFIGIPEWILIGISSLLFGFAHWEKWTGSWGAWKIVQAFLMGLFLSYAFVKYGIESSIFIHMANNVLTGLVLAASFVGINWIVFLTGFVVIGLLLPGAMKSASAIVNIVLTYIIRKREEKEKFLQKDPQ